MPAESQPIANDTPALLVEQARALVQSEESRFSAAQARVSALLAVVGVLGGIGGSVLTGLDGRAYAGLRLGGSSLPIVHLLVILFGLVAIGALLWSAATAIGALKEQPEPSSKSEELDQLVETAFPQVLATSSSQAAIFLISFLAGQRKLLREASGEVDEAFERATRVLGIAVASGLFLSLAVLFGTSGKPQQVYLVQGHANDAVVTTSGVTLGQR
jgi:hypothetical protein